MRSKKLYKNLFKNYAISKFNSNGFKDVLIKNEIYFVTENTEGYVKDVITYLFLNYGLKPKTKFKKISKNNPFNQVVYFTIKPSFVKNLEILDKTSQIILPNLENYLLQNLNFISKNTNVSINFKNCLTHEEIENLPRTNPDRFLTKYSIVYNIETKVKNLNILKFFMQFYYYPIK